MKVDMAGLIVQNALDFYALLDLVLAVGTVEDTSLELAFIVQSK